ncbi:unnamed protein product [Parajaminaea phylloscopi]
MHFFSRYLLGKNHCTLQSGIATRTACPRGDLSSEGVATMFGRHGALAHKTCLSHSQRCARHLATTAKRGANPVKQPEPTLEEAPLPSGSAKRYQPPQAEKTQSLKFDNAALRNLKARGLIQAVSSSHIDAHLSSAQRSIYLGVDPTAASLHIGHLLPVLALLHMVRAGHRGVLLVGGATASIGDPSGKTSSRPDLPADHLAANIAALTHQLHGLLQQIADHLQIDRSSLDIQVLNNADFYTNLNLIDFLRDVGRYTRLGDMLARDSVKSRLPPPTGVNTSTSAGLSFTEFTYQLLQAYDFSLLNENKDVGHCTIQLGGSDQMGNIMAGVELIRRKKFGSASTQKPKESSSEASDNPNRRQPPAYALTLPLLTTSSGEKLGKSAGNAVFLSPAFSSDYDFYQYFVRLTDEDVDKLTKSLTFLPVTEGSENTRTSSAAHDETLRIRHDRLALAREVTQMTRGKNALDRALLMTQLLHEVLPAYKGSAEMQRAVDACDEQSRGAGSTGIPDGLLTWQKLTTLAKQEEANGMPAERRSRRIQVYNAEQLGDDVLSLDLISLFERVGLATSKSEARRILSSKDMGGYSIFNLPLNRLDPKQLTTRKLAASDVVWFDKAKDDSMGQKKRGMLWLRRGKKDGKLVLIEA